MTKQDVGQCRRGGIHTLLAICLLIGVMASAQARSPANAELGLSATPAKTLSAQERALRRLGEQLFFDTRLSADGNISCATCHKPALAFTDGLARSTGHRGVSGTRNAPSLLNVSYEGSLFWDGRAQDLDSQVVAPLTNPVEHALASRDVVVEVVGAIPSYRQELAQIFHVQNGKITPPMVSQAISAYERSLVCADSWFDRFQYGHDASALTPAAARGLDLFVGRAQCSSCHLIETSHALLTDGLFHESPGGIPKTVSERLAMLATEATATASRGATRELERLIATDPGIAALGRFVATLNPADIGKFKTPSLRNVALTAPYMHDGSVATLEEAVDLELYGRGSALQLPIALTLDEKHELVEFLRSLSSAPSCRASAKQARQPGN